MVKIIEPTKPNKPIEPSKMKETFEKFELRLISTNSFDRMSIDCISVKKMVEAIGRQPDIDKLRIEVDSFDGEIGAVHVVGPAAKTMQPNNLYEWQMITYKIDLNKYETEMIIYNKEMIKYNKIMEAIRDIN